MRNLRILPKFLLCCLVLAAPATSQADGLTVANQLYNMDGRLEIMLTPSLSTFDKYTRHIATSAGVAYYFNDYIGLELDIGYAFVSGDRKLLDEILGTAENLDGIQRLPLTDLKYFDFWSAAGFVLNPLYGKLNLSAELAVSFHLYLVGGGGIAHYNYSELNWTGGTYQKVKVDAGFQPMVYFGGGLRMHFVEDWSLRVEIRDQFIYDKYDAQHKPSGTTVEDKMLEDFVHVVMFRLGVCYAF